MGVVSARAAGERKMAERFHYNLEPADQVPVFGNDHRFLGTLVRRVTTIDGRTLFGIVALSGGDYLPLPWPVMRFANRECHADVDHEEISLAPRIDDLKTCEFDEDLADKVEAAFGTEFPGIEGMSDFA
jgi:hypothetical protein